MNFIEMLKQRSIELGFLGISVLALCVALLINKRISEQLEYYSGFTYKESQRAEKVADIVVDIDGSVVSPGVYRVSADSRLGDVIKRAGGLSDDADAAYIQQHFNRAQTVVDQQKIYLPSVEDVKEMKKSGAGAATGPGNALGTAGAVSGININTASADELDSLPGIGVSTVEKIVSGRPYTSLEEVKEKKAITSSQYESIKDLVTVY